ncbi:uncharacterized protein LOC6564651 [Drosophila grimshawi]|uniref:uncharacterized protein LOC6564651 n=1 Tax=Drosophila grimshawi TaxID=7222 RepID=UPI001C935CAB|nr:uncharacterized protein LOC6564651 [Drosophila grimshawi]
MRYLELQKLNQENSIKASSVTQRLETEIERQKLQIEELFGQNQDLKANEKHHQTEIRALQEANDQLKDNSALKDSAAQAELRKSENQLSQLRQQIEGLQQNHLNTSNTLSAENYTMTQEFEKVKLQYEQKLAALQNELKLKNAEIVACQQHFTELKCSSNATIAELNYKISSIGKHFCQPVGTARVLSRRETDDSIVSQTAPVTISPEEPLNTANVGENSNDTIFGIAAHISDRLRMLPERQRKTNNWYGSDFISDSEDNVSNSEPKQLKLNEMGPVRKEMAKLKRTKKTSAFDTLKNS